jgi:hypothetical protein
MLLISFLFASLLLLTPPLILAGWVVLLARVGLPGSRLRQIKILTDAQEQTTKNRIWLILAIGVFGILIMFCLGLNILLSLEGGREWNAIDSGTGEYSSIVLSFLYSPIMSILSLEAWLVLVSYFGFHYIIHHFNVSENQGQWIEKFAVTAIQLIGIFTGLIGFVWWSYVGIMDQGKLDSSNNFSLVELSPITVLLTIGLVIMLFISLGRITAIEQNTEQLEQIAGKMALTLLSVLISLGLVGGILSILIHQARSPW